MAKVGKDCKLYYRVAGTQSPFVPADWTELTNVRDASTNLEKGEADASTRGSGGWRATLGTLKNGAIEFEMVWDPTDAGFTALQEAFFNDAAIGIAALDGDADGATTQGLVCDMNVLNFTRNEPLEDTVTVSVSLKPAFNITTPPFWYDAAGGS